MRGSYKAIKRTTEGEPYRRSWVAKALEEIQEKTVNTWLTDAFTKGTKEAGNFYLEGKREMESVFQGGLEQFLRRQ